MTPWGGDGGAVARPVTEWHLEMRDPRDLVPSGSPPAGMSFRRLARPSPEVSRALYGLVGRGAWWTDRLDWSLQDWRHRVEQPRLSTWLAITGGTVAGFFEIEAQEHGDTEIHLVGLSPRFVGRGFGGHLVHECALRGWSRTPSWGAGFGETRRVHLRTSSLDHPHALPTYLKRGFRVVEETTREASVEGTLELVGSS